ncbi:SDR family NAD(P)-dependent oxidoreductase [Nocardioides sambongensis]|uniref:SDR family NAD(P)-dependent oxidoreductase n=1 Tax=Nocardioides sambongensis TaxID=2589074 RepID=UPI00112BAFC5|nr:SDR family oxidoreductase [Nocardioides sambongensis]
MLRFSGTNVLLTGAASGIGRATALRLAGEGAAVVGVDRDADGLDEVVRSAAGMPGRIVTGLADITDEAAVAGAVDAAVDRLGGIDVLVNVAGTHRTTPIATLSVEDLRSVYEVNLVGTALFCREALRHLPDQGGVIVNVASAAATQGNPYMTAYAASKGAVLGFTLSLAAEVVGRGIRVLAVSPGQVATPLTAGSVPGDLDMRYYGRIVSPMGAAEPEQIAGTIAYAASRDASYMTGVELRVDGGSRI